MYCRLTQEHQYEPFCFSLSRKRIKTSGDRIGSAEAGIPTNGIASRLPLPIRADEENREEEKREEEKLIAGGEIPSSVSQYNVNGMFLYKSLT